ncbi:hypothetical protein Lalb_Chr03g0030751 [Lupinus albus]|uniref:Nucleic acid-binding protein n=1 Tax=Lupinus albus TaxID=3870 RepID=A0A6A4QUA9_LUPAL|nr:hypothetical protein Lalb_Chr03g0030751 [Lupinus albus]
MSLSRPFNFINDLNDSKHLWKIVVRITQLWYVQIPPKPGHLEMILMDSKVIGVFDKLIFSQTQSNLKKVIFTMKDFCGDIISCTLWETHAMKSFNYFNNQPIVQPLVILLTNARVKKGQGHATNKSCRVLKK